MHFFTCKKKKSDVEPKDRLARGVAQSGRVPALGAGCRRFKSYRPDHKKDSF